MPSAYPGAFDSLPKPTATTKEDDPGFEHDVVHTVEAQAIEAVQSTLGVNPQGGSATVVARLDAVDSAVAGKVSSSDSRLSDARTPTAHAASHGSGGSDAITVAPSQVTGTAVVTSDSRLSDARTPTAHAASHGSAGSDAITVAQSQVTNLTTDLSGKVAVSTIDAKGDLLVGTADNTIARQGVGTDGYVLTADSSLTNGIKWAAASGGVSAGFVFAIGGM
jgi:hypothetical protein